ALGARSLVWQPARPRGDPPCSPVYHRPLAHRHDAVARDAHPRPTTRLSEHVSMFGAEPFPVDRIVVRALVPLPAALPTTDGQHARWMGAAARRRVRPVHDGPTFALPDHRLSQSPPARSRSA